MTNQKYLNSIQLERLRSSEILSREEVAYWAGDILVAEHVITGEKRALHEGARVLNESSNPTLLKG